MKERRKHKRLPVIKDLAEPIELAITDPHSGAIRHLPGVLTNLSAGGMDLVLLGALTGNPQIKLNMHLPGFDRFEVEGKLVWSRPKGNTSVVGIQFTKIETLARSKSFLCTLHWTVNGVAQKEPLRVDLSKKIVTNLGDFSHQTGIETALSEALTNIVDFLKMRRLGPFSS
jgi:hypothetical protein